MSFFNLKPNDLIDYSNLLEQKYLHPYWQYYYKDINISFVTENQYKNLSFIRSDENLTTVGVKNDFVSIYSKFLESYHIYKYSFRLNFTD